jgi:hypothetical protein
MPELSIGPSRLGRRSHQRQGRRPDLLLRAVDSLLERAEADALAVEEETLANRAHRDDRVKRLLEIPRTL